MRPTGRLHIGHYFGALQNWVRLQNLLTADGKKDYECFYFIADWHALTSDYADTSGVAQNTIEIMTDYLAAGLDPQKSVLFQQSLVPEHAELHLLLSMVTPLGWLERVPTYKEALENVKDKDLHNYGFLGYPVLQCADIVIYSSPAGAGEEGAQLFVPVGEDQVSHVETSREIVRAFDVAFRRLAITDELARDPQKRAEIRINLMTKHGAKFPSLSEEIMREMTSKKTTPDFALSQFLEMCQRAAREWGHTNFLQKLGPDASYFRENALLQEPQVMLTHTPKIPGLDGRKMSKSYGNTITLSEGDAGIRAKTKVMVTDPARKRRTDPGNPDVCPVYDWHKLFSTKETLAWAAHGCRTAGIGCIECKAKMADHLIEWITPVRERRVEYEKHPKKVVEILEEGSKKARVVAQATMERVREAVFGWDKKRKEVGEAAAKT
jgi:tryptophanyl-tRNA synthetase